MQSIQPLFNNNNNSPHWAYFVVMAMCPTKNQYLNIMARPGPAEYHEQFAFFWCPTSGRPIIHVLSCLQCRSRLCIVICIMENACNTIDRRKRRWQRQSEIPSKPIGDGDKRIIRHLFISHPHSLSIGIDSLLLRIWCPISHVRRHIEIYMQRWRKRSCPRRWQRSTIHMYMYSSNQKEEKEKIELNSVM